MRKLRHREREVTSPPWVSSRSGPPTLAYWLSEVHISAHYTVAITLIWKKPKRSPFWQWETESLTKVVIYPPYTLTQRQLWAPNSVSLISVNSIQFHKYCLCKCYVPGLMLTAVVTSAYKHRHRDGRKEYATHHHLALWVRGMGNYFLGKSKSKFKQDDLGEEGWGEVEWGEMDPGRERGVTILITKISFFCFSPNVVTSLCPRRWHLKLRNKG